MNGLEFTFCCLALCAASKLESRKWIKKSLSMLPEVMHGFCPSSHKNHSFRVIADIKMIFCIIAEYLKFNFGGYSSVNLLKFHSR